MVDEIKKETPTEKKQVVVDANTVMYILYLLYKTNIINNLNLKEALNEIKKQAPEDLVAYFQKEFTKM